MSAMLLLLRAKNYNERGVGALLKHNIHKILEKTIQLVQS
jgi:hypothetical protein